MKLSHALPAAAAALLCLNQCYVGPPPEMLSGPVPDYGPGGMSELGTMPPPPSGPYSTGGSYGDPAMGTGYVAPPGHTPSFSGGASAAPATENRHFQQGLEAGTREREDGDPYNPAVHIARYRLTGTEAASFERGYQAGYNGRR